MVVGICKEPFCILGRCSSVGVELRRRIAPLVTEQSASCPLHKQAGDSDQYGHQTRPSVGFVCARLCEFLNMCENGGVSMAET